MAREKRETTGLTKKELEGHDPFIYAKKVRSGSGYSVMMAVLLSTFCENKHEAEISMDMFQERTNLNRPRIRRAIKNLVEIGWISVVAPETYRVGKELERSWNVRFMTGWRG